MYELRNMKGSDSHEIEKIWRTAFESKFLVSDHKLEYCLFEDPDLYLEGCFICQDQSSQELIGMIAVKVSGEKQIYPDTAWISMFFVVEKYQGKGIGTNLYKEAEQALRKIGVKTIYIGQDYRYLFSGIPAPLSYKESFFKKLGFDINEAEHYDLEGNIIVNNKIDEFEVSHFEKDFFTETLREEDTEKLYSFLKQEFPGRWELEAAAYLQENGEKSHIVVLKDRLDSSVKGYCMLSVEAGMQGSLGPIGIASAVRGKKVGDYILQQSLLQLRRLGVETVYINWTILKDFYAKFNFAPFRIYRSAYKEI